MRMMMMNWMMVFSASEQVVVREACLHHSRLAQTVQCLDVVAHVVVAFPVENHEGKPLGRFRQFPGHPPILQR